MAKIINYSCDGCYKIIYGKDKNIFVKRPHIQINGQIIEQNIDSDTGWQSHIFITPTPEEKLCFCDLDCLAEYIKTRKFLWEQRREEILRGQAGKENEARIEKR